MANEDQIFIWQKGLPCSPGFELDCQVMVQCESKSFSFTHPVGIEEHTHTVLAQRQLGLDGRIRQRPNGPTLAWDIHLRVQNQPKSNSGAGTEHIQSKGHQDHSSNPCSLWLGGRAPEGWKCSRSGLLADRMFRLGSVCRWLVRVGRHPPQRLPGSRWDQPSWDLWGSGFERSLTLGMSHLCKSLVELPVVLNRPWVRGKGVG